MLFEETQQQYILAEQKARAQEEAVRHINQKQVDKAMDVRDDNIQIWSLFVC